MSEFDSGIHCAHGIASCDPCLEAHSKRVRDLEAQAGAMRAEIIRLVDEYVLGADHHRDDCPEDGGCEECQESDRINAALASSAGKQLLERLERAEMLAGTGEALDLYRHIRGKVLEEAADEVASYPGGDFREMAEHIRGLAERKEG